MKNEIFINTILLFTAAFIAFFFVPLFMIGNAPSSYAFIDASVFYKTALLYTVLFGLLLNIISLPFQLLDLKRTTNFYVYFVLSWVVLSGFILPVSSSTGMVDPENNPINYTNLFIALTGSLLFSILSVTVLKKYVKIFLLIVLLTSVIPAIVNIYNSDTLKSIDKDHSSLKVSNKKNIFVISFDGMPGEIITDVIKNHKNYSNELKDFVIFENAVSQAPATTASLIGDIYGIHDYKSKGETIGKVWKALKEEGLFDNIISEHISDSFQYGYPGYSIDKLKISSPVINARNEFDTFDFFKYPIVRLWTSKVLKEIGWKNNILPIRRYVLKTKNIPLIIKKLEKHNGENWDKKNILSLDLFNTFVSDISVTDKEFSLRYLHLTFTHFPVDYDAECKYRSDDKVWYDTNQNEKGIRNQDICAVGKFINFIHKLKKLGIYDNSLIVFKSDHGKPTNSFSKLPNTYMINEHKRWGYARYKPTLMIKDFGSHNLEPTYMTELVLLNDIARTLCEKSNEDIDCKNFPGVNLLGHSLDNNQSYYLYVAKDSSSSFDYKSHISVEIPSRNVSLQKAMERSELIKLSEPQEVYVARTHMIDLKKVKKALSDYFTINQKYPKGSKSNSWDGVCTKWGESTPDYIKGLAPKFIKTLPVDPRKNKNCAQNYLYRSNAKDYKFLIHEVKTNKIPKNFIDPVRKKHAYGIWTNGAIKW